MSGPTLTERITRELETRLIEGVWAPGERIPSERALALSLGVARSTVRAALQRLVARGLLKTRAASGVYVSDRLQTGLISPWRQLVSDHPELRPDMLEFRLMLEGTTAYLAAVRATDEDLARLSELVDGLVDAHERGDTVRESRLDGDFHTALANASSTPARQRDQDAPRAHLTQQLGAVRSARAGVGNYPRAPSCTVGGHPYPPARSGAPHHARAYRLRVAQARTGLAGADRALSLPGSSVGFGRMRTLPRHPPS